MMRRIDSIAVGALFAVLTLIVTSAQQPEPLTPVKSNLAVTGCLTRASSNSYLIEEPSGARMSVTGPAELADHVAETVRLEGTMNATLSTFRATSAHTIATSCGG